MHVCMRSSGISYVIRIAHFLFSYYMSCFLFVFFKERSLTMEHFVVNSHEVYTFADYENEQ